MKTTSATSTSMRLAVALGLLVSLLAIESRACTCVGVGKTTEQIRGNVELSSIVAVVEVIELGTLSFEYEDEIREWPIARARIVESFKGAGEDRVVEISDIALCGPRLRERETFLVFLSSFENLPSFPDPDDVPYIAGCRAYLIHSPKDIVPSRYHHDTSRAESLVWTLRSLR